MAASPGVLGCGLCCFDVSAFFGNNNDDVLTFSSLLPSSPQHWQVQAAFFLADPFGFLPSHMQERRGSEGMAGMTKLRVIF